MFSRITAPGCRGFSFGGTLQTHEVADIFPNMSDEEYRELKSDIERNGQIESIWTHDGKIIDGRHRYKACSELGITPKTKEWGGEGSLIEFVVSLNLRRRHLILSQKAALAVDLLPRLEAEAKVRQAHGLTAPGKTLVQKIAQASNGRSREKAADIFSINRQYVSDAKKIHDEAPELLDRMRNGLLTMQDAKRELKTIKQTAEAESNPWPQDQQRLKEQLDSGLTIVVNVDRQSHITDYARKNGKLVMIDRSSPWGNVFVIGDDGTRSDVCKKYKDHYLPHKNKLQKELLNLSGVALGCHCKPDECHGDTMSEIVNENR